MPTNRRLWVTSPLLIAVLLGVSLGWAQPPSAPPPPAPPAGGDLPSHDHEEEDGSLFTAYLAAAGRPAWAPLEMLWGLWEWRVPLLSRLSTENPTERARAALALGLTGAYRAKGRLTEALEDRDPLVRSYAALALVYLGDARGQAGAERVVRRGEVWERYLAVIGLWRVDSPAARAALRAAHPGQGPMLRDLIPQALATPAWRPVPPYPSRRPPPPAAEPGEDLWEQVADNLTLASDYWWHQGDYDQVCVLLEQALFFSPHRVETYDDVAWLQWSLGRGERAVQVLERGIALNPESWLAHFNLGFHYFNTKRYAQATAYLKYAAEHTETWWVPLHTYAHDLEALGRYDEAVEVWKSAIERFPEDEMARRNLARLLRTLQGEGG